MKQVAAKLLEELTAQTVFTIPLFGGIAVSESVVVTWLIMAVLLALSIYLTHDLKLKNPSSRQLVAETIVSRLDRFTGDLLGTAGGRYQSYIEVVLIYLAVANLIGIFSLKPPTKDLNVPIALALMSILLVEYAGIRARGTVGWLKSFAEPVAVVAPLNFLEIFIRPLSLCMRLFGNVLGAFVIMELVKLVLPIGVPAILSLYFDLFDGLIQAYVFVFLTSLYLREAVEKAEE